MLSPAEYDSLSKSHGANYACWEAFDRWLRVFRDEHPYDERSDLELIEVYGKTKEEG